MKLTLEDIIQDLRALDSRIRANERKYGITSEDFYSLYREGLLDNEGYEQTTEYGRWASAYSMKLEREATFQAPSRVFVSGLRQRTAGQASLPCMSTVAPSAANCSAISLPMPAVEPAIKTTLSLMVINRLVPWTRSCAPTPR